MASPPLTPKKGPPVLRVFLALAASLAGAAVGLVLYASWRWVTPPRAGSLSFTDLPGEGVRFSSRDGTRLYGRWLAGRADYPTVVLCHGYIRSLEEPLELGLALNRAGYNVLLFDFRGCGRSGGRFTTLGYKEAWDLLAAVHTVQARHGREPIGVLGISMGAAAAIMAAAHCPSIAALVLDSPYPHLEGIVRKKMPEIVRLRWLMPLGWLCVRLGLLLAGGSLERARPVDAIGRIPPRPILFIRGEQDSFIPQERFQELVAAAGGPKEVWTAPGSDHAMARLDHPEEYLHRVRSFFDRYLRGADGPYSGMWTTSV